jgi:hypothetical protein
MSNPSTQEAEENYEFKASLSYIGKPYLKTRTKCIFA